MAGFLNGTDPGLRQTRTPTRQILTNGSGFTANSSTTIALTNDPGTEDHVQISFDGIIQHHSTYTVSGTTVTFDAVIPAGVAEIEASFVVTVSSITVPDSSVSTSKIVDANVTEAKLQDNSVSLSKMASGTDGNIISFDSSGNPVAIATGTDGQVLTSAGAGAQPAFETLPTAGFTLGSDTTASGATPTFGSIPAATKVIIINFEGVSLNGNGDVLVQIGDAAGIETSGYVAGSSRIKDAAVSGVGSSTAAFNIDGEATGNAFHGSMILTLKDADNFTWASTHSTFASTTRINTGGGTKSLTAELTQIKLSASAGAFDAGTVNIAYM